MEMKVKYDGKKFVEFEGETVAEALLKVDGTLVKCGIDAGSFKAVTIDKLDFFSMDYEAVMHSIRYLLGSILNANPYVARKGTMIKVDESLYFGTLGDGANESGIKFDVLFALNNCSIKNLPMELL